MIQIIQNWISNAWFTSSLWDILSNFSTLIFVLGLLYFVFQILSVPKLVGTLLRNNLSFEGHQNVDHLADTFIDLWN
jgi:hypothetical protein